MSEEKRPEAMLTRFVVRAELKDGVPLLHLECGHVLKCPELTMTSLGKIRDGIVKNKRYISHNCAECAAIPRPPK